MRRIRVIPSLLIKGEGLVKGAKFKNHKYVGDPINAVKIFNEKEVDELAILDIGASKEGRSPDISKIAEIASEAFMPLSYGGGIKNIDQVRELLFNGIEKVIINKVAHSDHNFLKDVSKKFGSQSLVVSIDVKKNIFGRYKVFLQNGSVNSGKDPVEFAREMEQVGVGEIYLTAIDREGSYKGYDIELINIVSKCIGIPVVANGGASTTDDYISAINAGASAVSAGSMFVFKRPHNAVLISYPSSDELTNHFYNKI